MEITFVTTNDEKWRIARQVLQNYPIELGRAEVETPEIQAAEVEEIAGYSAEYAAKQLEKPVIVTDGGYYISALNGFPGPFQKFMNQWLTPEDFINLMKPYDDRSVMLKTCLAFCEPVGKPVTFTSVVHGEIAYEPAGIGSILDQILILDGLKQPQGAYPIELIRKHWAKGLNHYRQFGEYIKQRQKL